MSRVSKKNRQTQPENMADFQSLLDSNKEKLAEGDYLALCNGMKRMFEKEEKNAMVICKVQTLTHELRDTIDGYCIEAIENQVILNLSERHFQQLTQNLIEHKIVHMPAPHYHHSDITLNEGPCGESECECDGCSLPGQMTFKRTVRAPTYITNIIPKELWNARSDLQRGANGIQYGRTIAHIFDI